MKLSELRLEAAEVETAKEGGTKRKGSPLSKADVKTNVGRHWCNYSLSSGTEIAKKENIAARHAEIGSSEIDKRWPHRGSLNRHV